MSKPFQFSIDRLLCAVACFAFAAWSWTYLSKFDAGFHPWFVIGMTSAGTGIGLLAGRLVVGMAAGFLMGFCLMPA